MIRQNTILGAIEIGTSKVAVLIGEIMGGQALNLIGMYSGPSEGIKKGEILDFKAASASVHDAIRNAEQSAGLELSNVYLSQTGSHLLGELHSSIVNVSSSSSLVSTSDIERVIQEAKSKELPADRVYIQNVQHPYRLDGRIVLDPYRMQGSKLEVDFWSVHGDLRRVRDPIHVINGFGLKVQDVILSSLATTSSVTTEAERKAGVLVIDIGSGTTDYALYKNGYLANSGVIAVGGDHFTNDLSFGLRINWADAERLKCELGYVNVRDDDDENVWLIGDQSIGDRQISRYSIAQILDARARELFTVIGKNLGLLISKETLPAGLILAGGASRLSGMESLAEDILKIDAKHGENPQWVSSQLQGLEYSTVLGVLQHAASDVQQDLPADDDEEKGILHKVVNFFTPQSKQELVEQK